MTEYDYSPEGYQRYMDNQNRVARWVDNTQAHAHEFRAPFGARSDIDEEEIEERYEFERDMHGSPRHGPGHGRRSGGPDDFREMSAGLSTVGVEHYGARPPVPHSSFPAAMPQSYAPAPRASAPLPGQASYSSLYPSYIPQPHPQPQTSGYTTPSPLVSASATPPPPIVIQRISKHHSRHHHDRHDHHHSSSNSSRSKPRTRTYIIQPAAPSSAPVQYTIPNSGSYPGQYGGSVTGPPQAAYPTNGYPTSPPVATTNRVVSPKPTYGYPNTQTVAANGNTITHVPGYVIVSPKGRDVKVLYA